MRPPATLALVFAGLAVFAAAALMLAPAARKPDASIVEQPAAATPSTDAPAPAPQPAPQVSSARTIAPGIVAVPALQPRGLEREAPRAPLSRVSRAPEPSKPVVQRFYRPLADAAGSFRASRRVVRVRGVEIVPTDRVCDAGDGTTWPCGMRARTAFRAFLRGRAVDCRVGKDPPKGTLTAPCSLNGVDLGEWLVANGWAEATDDGPYAKAGRRARDAKLGLFGPGPARP